MVLRMSFPAYGGMSEMAPMATTRQRKPLFFVVRSWHDEQDTVPRPRTGERLTPSREIVGRSNLQGKASSQCTSGMCRRSPQP